MRRDGWQGSERSMRFQSHRSHLAQGDRRKERAMDWEQSACAQVKWCNLLKKRTKTKRYEI